MAKPVKNPKTIIKAPDSLKGRGVRSNASSRYNKLTAESVDDEWADSEPAPKKTDVTAEFPRTIINWINSPYVPFDRSINPYRGCEHGCTYCFARPSHAYYGLSPGLDFERQLFVKPAAATLLRKELSKPRYKPGTIAIGTNTDPYQPIEKSMHIMRSILGVLQEFQHPVSILTKSALITRDIDIIEPMGSKKLAKAMVSITTRDSKLARAMEPRASTPARRFDAVRQLADAGAVVGVMAAPMIPGLNDSEMEAILEEAKEAGAQFAGFTVIRLPMEVTELFREWIEATFPNRAARVLRHIREMNGGRDYDPAWSRAPQPRSVFAKLIEQRFRMSAGKLGLDQWPGPLTTKHFRPPLSAKPQLSLFDESEL